VVGEQTSKLGPVLVAGAFLAIAGIDVQFPSAGALSEMSLVNSAYAAETKTLSAAPTAFVDTEALRHLRKMGKYLAAAQEISFRAEVTDDVLLSSGQMIQDSGVASVSVQRPDALHVSYSGDRRNTRVFYDGKVFTILDVNKLVYTRTDVPPTIDAAVDKIFEEYDFSVPIADLVYAKPHEVLIENVETGFLVGRSIVRGTPTVHLAFSQEEIDWQIWIEDGPRPLPRKLVITYRDEPGSPQYTAYLSNWNLQPQLSEEFANFHPPANSDEIDFLRLAEPQPKAKK
jgi:hypothetical protein